MLEFWFTSASSLLVLAHTDFQETLRLFDGSLESVSKKFLEITRLLSASSEEDICFLLPGT